MSSPLNPLLGKVKLPGRVFQLPSKGLFYKPGTVLADTVKEGEIQVKPMSALTELKIRSADLLYSSKILREVCIECVPEILMPEKLVSRDVDALFTFLVASTYGSIKSIKAIHNCANAEFHDYDINLDAIIANPRNTVLNHVATMFNVDLPNGQKVKLKPCSFEDSIIMMNLRSALARKEIDAQTTTHADMEKIVVMDLMAVIEAVESGDDNEKQSVTNPAFIEEWLRELPKTYVNAIITTATQSADWGFDFTVKLKCKDCGEHYDYDIELNPINFFTG